MKKIENSMFITNDSAPTLRKEQKKNLTKKTKTDRPCGVKYST